MTRLGSTQMGLLRKLAQHGGSYSSTSRWVWGTAFDTVELLASLERRGLVVRNGYTWTLTEEGRRFA